MRINSFPVSDFSPQFPFSRYPFPVLGFRSNRPLPSFNLLPEWLISPHSLLFDFLFKISPIQLPSDNLLLRNSLSFVSHSTSSIIKSFIPPIFPSKPLRLPLTLLFRIYLFFFVNHYLSPLPNLSFESFPRRY